MEKRTANGLNKLSTERHNIEAAQYQPSHFNVDTETAWWVIALIQPNCGVVYQHRKTLRPMIIMCYEPGTLDDNEELVYFVFTPGINQDFNVYEASASVAREKLSKYLTLIDEMYVNELGALNADQSEIDRLAFMQSIGLVAEPLPTRKEVKAKRLITADVDVDKK